MNEKDVIEKKKFKNISKQYNKKENNIHDVWDDGKKGERAGKRIDRIVEKKKKHAGKKKIIYCLNVVNYNKLKKILSCETFYNDFGNKKKVLEEFVNEKQQIIVATSVFGMKINVVDIKVIVHMNEPKTMLDYAQESGRTRWDGKKSEVIIIWKQIRAAGRKERKRRRKEKKNESKKQMEQKKVIKFLETKCWKIALDKYLDGKKDWANCKEKKKWCQRCEKKRIKKKIEKKKIKKMIRKKIEEKTKERIERRIEKKRKKKKTNEK